MRHAAQMRLGYYQCPLEAVEMAAGRLRAPLGPFSLLDPCAGEGLAVTHLANLIGCAPASIFAIELEEGRTNTLASTIGAAGGTVLAPASVFGVGVSRGAFSLIWLNPPFDDSIAGGRTEVRWLQQVTPWLAPGGIVALVCPARVVEDGYVELPYWMREWYENVTVLPFGEAFRNFNEVIVLAVKRVKPAEFKPSWEKIHAPDGFLYHLPKADNPRYFAKTGPTEAELWKALQASPLRQKFTLTPLLPLPSPPLAPGTGHVALLLASGHLDGTVAPAGESPHLVRGTSRKKTVLTKVEVTENEKSVTEKKTFTEKIDLIVRCLDLTGSIRTFCGIPADQEADPNAPEKQEDPHHE